MGKTGSRGIWMRALPGPPMHAPYRNQPQNPDGASASQLYMRKARIGPPIVCSLRGEFGSRVIFPFRVISYDRRHRLADQLKISRGGNGNLPKEDHLLKFSIDSTDPARTHAWRNPPYRGGSSRVGKRPCANDIRHRKRSVRI